MQVAQGSRFHCHADASNARNSIGKTLQSSDQGSNSSGGPRNKILAPAFPYEAAARRLPRRLSRIAKGPRTRCSKLALARIAKGGGLIALHPGRNGRRRAGVAVSIASTRKHRQ
jgi:hypothetical protein